MTVFNTYSVGTAGVVNGSSVINGAGTLWSGINVRPGDDIELDGHTVVILDVLSATQLQISPWPYASVPVSASPASPYKIIWRSPLRYAGGQAMADVDALISSLSNPLFTGNVGVAGFVQLGDTLVTSGIKVGNFLHLIGRNAGDGSLYIGGGQANVEIDALNPFKVKNNTQSVSSTTGALTVTGGLGVDRNVNIGGSITANSYIQTNPAITVTGTFGVSNEVFRSFATRSGNATGGSARMFVLVDTDSVNHTGDVPTVYIEHNFSGSNFGTHAIYSLLTNTAVTAPVGGPGWYVGIQSDLAAAYGSGGSAGSANWKGTWQGITSIVSARSGATFLNGIGGAEFDVCLNAGSSAGGKICLNLVSGDGGVGSDALHAINTLYDTALNITAATTADVGFYQGIVIGQDGFGWPIAATGTIMGSQNTANSRTADYGISFRNVTFGIAFLDGPGFRVDGSGKTAISTVSGTYTESSAALAVAVDSNNFRNIIFRDHSNNTSGPSVKTQKSRNATLGSHTIVQSGDTLFAFDIDASDGSAYVRAASLKCEVDGTPGSGDMPGRWVWYTTPDGSSTPLERMRIDNKGNMVVNTAAIATNASDGFLYVPSCAGTPTGTPTTYSGRVPIVVDTTNNRWYFYSTGAWRNAGP